jgi:hypothetical protein
MSTLFGRPKRQSNEFCKAVLLLAVVLGFFMTGVVLLRLVTATAGSFDAADFGVSCANILTTGKRARHGLNLSCI